MIKFLQFANLPARPIRQSHFANRGFTLIELLVVVAIIGLLSSVISFSVSQTRIGLMGIKTESGAKSDLTVCVD